MLNLTLNARDAMSESGALTIMTGNVEINASHAANTADAQVGPYVRLAVRDSGTGMSKEVIEQAVEPFFSTKEPGGGSGLGLSMIYGFATQSGGHMTIVSEPGHGTTVSLYLPVARDQGMDR